MSFEDIYFRADSQFMYLGSIKYVYMIHVFGEYVNNDTQKDTETEGLKNTFESLFELYANKIPTLMEENGFSFQTAFSIMNKAIRCITSKLDFRASVEHSVISYFSELSEGDSDE